MPLTSAFTPCGLLECSGETADAENIYNTLKAQLTPAFNVSDSTYEGCELYAMAMQLAWARAALKRARRELHPLTCYDLLTTLEKDWSCVPLATDTLYQRQLRIAARKLIMRGAREEALVTDLLAAIGSDFLRVNGMPESDATNYPTTATDVGTFPAPGQAPRFYKLTTSVPRLGAPYTVGWSAVNASSAPLVGDKLTIEPEVTGIAEAVTVTAVTLDPVTNTGTLTATFTKAHSANAWACTATPLWLSNRYELQIVVTAAAAADATKRHAVNEVMRRHAKSCEAWCVAAASSSTTVGPFVIGNGIIGSTVAGDASAPF
jgi:hypothetical protein